MKVRAPGSTDDDEACVLVHLQEVTIACAQISPSQTHCNSSLLVDLWTVPIENRSTDCEEKRNTRQKQLFYEQRIFIIQRLRFHIEAPQMRTYKQRERYEAGVCDNVTRCAWSRAGSISHMGATRHGSDSIKTSPDDCRDASVLCPKAAEPTGMKSTAGVV